MCLDCLKDESIRQAIKEIFNEKDINLLYDLEELLEDFEGLKIVYYKTEDTILDEGRFHAGIADIVRIVGIKG